MTFADWRKRRETSLWLVLSNVRRLLSDAAIGEKYGDFHAVAIFGELI